MLCKVTSCFVISLGENIDKKRKIVYCALPIEQVRSFDFMGFRPLDLAFLLVRPCQVYFTFLPSNSNYYYSFKAQSCQQQWRAAASNLTDSPSV